MSDERGRLGHLMQATIADEGKSHDWFYDAVRPMAVPGTWGPGTRVVGDCSKGVQYLCRWAGVLDPMGMHFGPFGNSQTLATRLQHLDNAGQLLVGDIVTFGVDGSEHAAMVMGAGTADPLLWSFGHQGAPDSYRLSYDRRESQLLRLPLPYVPTPVDRLKAKTTWFAWVAWKLGEGDWRAYGAANPHVRPNVPKVIPPGWWKRYAAFLAHRHQGNKASA